MARLGLLDDGLVQRTKAPSVEEGALRPDGDGEHHAVFDPVVAREEALERRRHRVRLDLGEVAEQADVDAEDRHLCLLHEVDGAQHRAVAAEADREHDVLGELLVGHREVEEVDGLGVAERHAHLVASLVQPLHGLAASSAALARWLCTTSVTALIEGSPPRTTKSIAAPGGRCDTAGGRGGMHEELDVPLRSSYGRHHPPHDDRSVSQERALHRLENRAPDRWVPDDAPASIGLGLSCLELRLHEEHEVGALVAHVDECVEHRADRDEREVGDDKVEQAVLGSGHRADVHPLVHLDTGVVTQRGDGSARGRRRPQRRERRPPRGGNRVKPPVDAPASRQRSPSTSMSNVWRAATSLSPPRLTKRAGGPSISTGSPAPTMRLALAAARPRP